MTHGICTLAIVPVRAAANHRSELVTQLLFGETYTVKETQQEWLGVQLDYDGYTGWIHVQQHTALESEDPILNGSHAIVDLSMHNFLLKIGEEEALHLLPGSNLPGIRDDRFSIGNTDYLFLGMQIEPEIQDFQSEISQAARFYLGAPYLWGGRSPFGMDCSGFTQLVFKHFGIPLLRDARQQAGQGSPVEMQDARPGDLVFLDSGEDYVSHVGILLDSRQVIHAYGKVRIDSIDEQGIYNAEAQSHSHTLRFARRMV